MYLRGGRGKCGLGILLVLMQCFCSQGDEDFQEFLFCTNSSSNRALECPDGEVIDIQQARVANLAAIGITNPCLDLSSKSAVTNIYYQQCKQDLSLLSCHGKQSCIVSRTMAAVWLPDCFYRWDDPPGQFSDVLYVNYTCQKRGVEEFLICATSSSERELRCQDGWVIDIQQARVANLRATGIPTNPCLDLSSKYAVTNIYFQTCKQELKFLSCHGKQSCMVNRTMAQVWLPDCSADRWDDDSLGRYSDVLYVRYVCYKLAAMTLLPLSDVTSHTFDVISPGFPDVTNEGQYNVTCTIIPSKETNEDITVQVEINLVMIESPLQGIISECLESLLVSLSGETLVCYRGIPISVRNDLYSRYTGRNFTLEYRSDGTVKHKFWMKFTATTVDSGDGVNMTIACTDNLPTTTTTTETLTTATETTTAAKITRESAESTEKSQNDGVIIGSVLGVLLLIVLVALIVVIVTYRKIIKRKDEAAAAPSGEVYSDTTSGELNNGGNTSGYINTSGPQEPYENFSSTYTSILEDNDANTTTDRGPINDEPGDYDYIKVVDNRNHYNNVVGTNGGAKYEDLLTATRATKKPEPYEELSIVAK